MTVLPLTLIIPTLNEKNNINKIIKNIKTLKCKEVIIVDGGSKDETCILLKNYKLINSYASRGKQLHLGAINSSEDWLLFLHADTELNNKNILDIKEFIKNDLSEKAAYFKLKFNNHQLSSRCIALWANLRTKFIKIPFGDQALLISKKYYSDIGGFNDIPIMEDLDFIIRISRKNKLLLKSYVTTSFRNYEINGIIKQSLKNIMNQIKFFMK